jgi:hypothetical protein
MQQRQPRLGDVLDDYCPRERRLTNHVVVAMIGAAVKQTRCTTCDADHEYKAAQVPRLRRKTESPVALAAQGVAAPKLHEPASKPAADESAPPHAAVHDAPPVGDARHARDNAEDIEIDADDEAQPDGPGNVDEGPVHRRLIRASLPRTEGQAPPTRPNPEFTIRQPTNNRQNRFRPRPGAGRGGPMPMNGNGGNGNRSFGGGHSQQRPQHQGGNQSRRRGGGGGRNRPK